MKTARVIVALVALLVLAVPAAASAAVDFPLRAWWPLNEGRGQTVYDWSGKGNHGFLGATPQADANDPAWTRGIFGTSALNFAGDDYVTVKDSNSLEPQQLTVGAWVKAPTSPGLFRYILAKGSQDCVAASYGLFTSVSGGLQFYVYDGARALYSGLQGPEIWDGKWHHVAGTFDGTQVKLFVDGKRVGDGDGPGTIEYGDPDGIAAIGGYHDSCDLMYSGDIDEVHVWSQALPVDQIWKKWGWLLGQPNRQ